MPSATKCKAWLLETVSIAVQLAPSSVEYSHWPKPVAPDAAVSAIPKPVPSGSQIRSTANSSSAIPRLPVSFTSIWGRLIAVSGSQSGASFTPVTVIVTVASLADSSQPSCTR